MRWVLVLFLAVGLPGPAWPEAVRVYAEADEILLTPSMDNYVTLNASDDGQMESSELVPMGTENDWRYSVIFSRVRNSTADEYETMLREIAEDEPDWVISLRKPSPGGVTLEGKSSEESFLTRAIDGARDVYIVYVAFKGVPSSKDRDWARRFLGQVVYCNRQSKAPPACKIFFSGWPNVQDGK
ncbi:hypothetical protein [Novosphingobium malaysiense]|nr:hypothetical protein [Novosphingobium malaysiense]